MLSDHTCRLSQGSLASSEDWSISSLTTVSASSLLSFQLWQETFSDGLAKKQLIVVKCQSQN